MSGPDNGDIPKSRRGLEKLGNLALASLLKQRLRRSLDELQERRFGHVSRSRNVRNPNLQNEA